MEVEVCTLLAFGGPHRLPYPLADARGFHEKAGLCQVQNPPRGRAGGFDGSRRRPTGGTIRPDHGPLSLITRTRFFGREEICQGRPRRRSEPLTDFLPSVQSRPRERGPGVSGGSPPWRSMRQRLMRAPARPSLSPPAVLPDFSSSLENRCLPDCLSRPVSPRFHPHSVLACRHGRCPLVFSIRGCCYLSSDLWSPSRLVPDDQPHARSHPNSALSHISQISFLPQCSIRNAAATFYAATLPLPWAFAAAASAAFRLYCGSYTSPVAQR